MNSACGRIAAAGVLVFVLAGCIGKGDTGFVQIKTAPASAVTQPVLYLDSVKLEPLKKGEAVLVQKTGTATLQAAGAGGQLAPLCDVVVEKNRVTTVTVSTILRQPRCQCSRNAGSAPQGSQMCVG
jgi:hypothetical protein